jgi:hypothetical protein
MGRVDRASGVPPKAAISLHRRELALGATSGHPGWMGSWFQPANYLILR